MVLPKVNKREGILLGILLGGGFAYLYYSFVVAPKLAELDAEKARGASLVQELAKAKLAAECLPAWKQAEVDAKAVIDKLPLPKTGDLAAFLKYLSDEADAKGITLTALTPQPKLPEMEFQKVPLTLSFRGSTAASIKYMETIIKGSHIFIITDAKLNPQSSENMKSGIAVDLTGYTLLKTEEVAGGVEPQPQPAV